MAKKLKRAFTIVELVIVIAVIAILAAVLIPTFTTLIDKANQSADTSNVKNMNSILAMDETTNGKPKTMDDAVKVIREGGYDLEKLTPTGQGYDIVWDQDANRLLMVNGEEVIFGETEKNANEKHLWVVVDSAEKIAATGYSVYLTDVFEGTVTAAQGVDVGSNEDITEIKYTTSDTQNVTIRTNGGAVTIEAANSEVDHYGTAQSVDIKAVKENSYHLYGIVEQTVSVAQGRVEVMNGASAAAIVVTATETTAASVKVDISNGAEVGKVTASDQAILDKVAVTDSSENKAQVVVGDDTSAILFNGGLGTEKNPYLIANVDQWKNFCDSELTTASKYWKVTGDIDLSAAGEYYAKQFKGYIDFGGHTVTGYSTQARYLSYLFMEVHSGSTITNLTHVSKGFAPISNALLLNGEKDIVFSNITTQGAFDAPDNNYTPYTWGVLGSKTAYDAGAQVKFINCTNYADITSTGSAAAGIFLGKIADQSNSYATYVTFDTCVNYGSLIHANGYAGMLISNGATFAFGKLEDITVKNCVNYGTILGNNPNNSSNLLCGAGWSQSGVGIEDIKAWCAANEENLKNAEGGSCSDTQFTEIVASGDNFDLSEIVALENVVSYRVSFSFWVCVYSSETAQDADSWGAYSITAKLTNLSEITLSTAGWISENDIPENAQKGTLDLGDITLNTCTIDGKMHYVIMNEVLGVDASQHVVISNTNGMIFAYNADGGIEAVYTFAYAE